MRDFVGKWVCNNKLVQIDKVSKTFCCSLPRPNIGIAFMDSLIVAEFDRNASVGGIGVYSPIGDGNSYSALWSSTRIQGELGSGIVLKTDKLEQIAGEYIVRYFIGKQETPTYSVKIQEIDNEDIYKLTWYQSKEIMLQGIGMMLNNSLAFSWGSVDADLSFNSFCFLNDKVLKMHTIKLNDAKSYCDNYTKEL